MGYSFPYIVLLVFYLGLFFLEATRRNDVVFKRHLRIICGGIYFIFFGFRGYIGSDWYNYEISYFYTQWGEWLLTDYEFGFSIIAKSFKAFELSYFNLVAFTTLLQVVLFDRFFSRYSETISLCYVIMIALFPVVIIDLQRNFTSILLVLNGLRYLERGQRLRFFMFVAAGMLFHVSAVVYFLLPVLTKKLFKKRTLIVLLILGLIVYFLQINFYKGILTFIGSVLGGRIEYLISQAVGEEESAYGLTVGILEKIGFYIALIFMYPRLRSLSPVIVNSCFVFILIYLFFSTSQSFINRFANLFSFGYILLYCNLVMMLLYKKNGFSAVAMIMLFFTLRTGLAYNNVLYKYVNILWEEDSREVRLIDRSFYYENR